MFGLAAGLLAGSVVFQAIAERYFNADVLASLNESFARPSVWTVGLALAFGLMIGFAPSTLAMVLAVMGYVRSIHAASTGRATRISAAFVASMDGTTQATADHTSHSVRVTYDPATTTPQQMVKRINTQTYLPRQPDTPTQRGPPAGGVERDDVPFGLISAAAVTLLVADAYTLRRLTTSRHH